MRFFSEDGPGEEQDAVQYPYATDCESRKVELDFGEGIGVCMAQQCKSVVKSETVTINQDDVVYVEGGEGPWLVGLVCKLYKCSKIQGRDGPSYVASVLWMYQWGDIKKKYHKKYHRSNEKYGNVRFPDGYREVMFSAHEDTVDILAVVRPIKVWFVNYGDGQFKFPEVTYIMGDSIRSEPVKGMICCRFIDTSTFALFPLEAVRRDKKSITFEDHLIPQVNAVMSRTDAWIRELKAREKRLHYIFEHGLHKKKAVAQPSKPNSEQTGLKRPRDSGGVKNTATEAAPAAAAPAPVPPPVQPPVPPPDRVSDSVPVLASVPSPAPIQEEKPSLEDLDAMEITSTGGSSTLATNLHSNRGGARHNVEIMRQPPPCIDESSEDDSESSMSLG
ncbi:hypothetical protein BSKO_08043 [Bryopsis sp. KO-2023]|nr:hypothetical protein BSKO_08043 [Bryopsis sp. KO-2023]